jgi:hypothetical protein
MIATTVEPNATNNKSVDVLSVVASSFQVPAVLACRLPHICYEYVVHCRNSTCGRTSVANQSLEIKCWPQPAGRRFHMLSTGNRPVIIYLAVAALAAIGRAAMATAGLRPADVALCSRIQYTDRVHGIPRYAYIIHTDNAFDILEVIFYSEYST